MWPFTVILFVSIGSHMICQLSELVSINCRARAIPLVADERQQRRCLLKKNNDLEVEDVRESEFRDFTSISRDIFSRFPSKNGNQGSQSTDPHPRTSTSHAKQQHCTSTQVHVLGSPRKRRSSGVHNWKLGERSGFSGYTIYFWRTPFSGRFSIISDVIDDKFIELQPGRATFVSVVNLRVSAVSKCFQKRFVFFMIRRNSSSFTYGNHAQKGGVNWDHPLKQGEDQRYLKPRKFSS